MLTVHLLFAFADAESWAFPGGASKVDVPEKIYEDLVNHLENARDASHEQYKRVRGMMLEIKSYARLLEADLSHLNQFTTAKRRGRRTS